MIFTDRPQPQFVYDDLVGIRSDLQIAVVDQTEAVGAATTIAEAYTYSPAALDDFLLQKVAEINGKKQQIVAILTDNFNRYRSGSGGCGIGTTTTVITGNSDTMKVVVAGTAKTFSYTRLGIGSTGVGAEVREDTLYSWSFPILEDVDVNAAETTFYEDSGTYLQVTSGTLGIGKTDKPISDVSNLQSIHQTSTFIGTFFPIVNTSPTGCAATVASVTALINEIVTIRSDIAAMLGDVNILKDRKTEKQLELLYTSISLNDTNKRLTAIENSIDAMENRQQNIVDYTP